MTPKAESTRRRITDAAIILFNRNGTREVHTHDIAAAAGLSPGNLYYHYKDKAEIVRDIFTQVELFSPTHWRESTSSEDPSSFYLFLEFFFSQLKRYRFFFYEQSDLIRMDPLLGKLWRKAHAELLNTMRDGAKHWVKLKILRPFRRSEDVDAFIHNCWILLACSYSYFESLDSLSASKLDDRVNDHIAAYLLPYHTEEGIRHLERYFERANLNPGSF